MTLLTWEKVGSSACERGRFTDVFVAILANSVGTEAAHTGNNAILPGRRDCRDHDRAASLEGGIACLSESAQAGSRHGRGLGAGRSILCGHTDKAHIRLR